MKSGNSMRVLILGGTAFVGRHVVEVALARHHEVTLFNRGRRNPDVFPELERLRGERPNDLAALRGRQWDVAIDTSGYTPRAGEVLAPDTPERAVQFIDVRDLAGWMLDKAEARQAGVFNTTGPERRLTMGEVLDTCRTVSGSDASFAWVDEKTLLEHNVAP